MGRKSSTKNGDLFIEESGQLRLTDKSAEQLAVEAHTVECLGTTFPNDEERRKHFLDILREKLKDPEFRKIEGFPIGQDEDILALSDPPYYTACPNPFLANLLAEGQRGAAVSPPYIREPFAADVSEGKNDPIYNAHSYHTKVPHQAIMQYILHYTEPGDVVLDSFCGSGMTGVAAAICGAANTSLRETFKRLNPKAKWGARQAILCDLGPAASLIAHNYNTPFDVQSEVARASRLLGEIEEDLGWAFSTAHNGWDSSDRTSKSRRNSKKSEAERGTVNFVLWSDVFVCPECSSEIVFWNAAADPDNASVKDTLTCDKCKAMHTKEELERATESVFDHVLKSVVSQRKQVPVLINYSVGTSRYEKTPDAEDLVLLAKANKLDIHERVPDQPFMNRGERWGDTWRAGYHYGFTHAHHFYTRRNLAVLARVWNEAIRTRSPFLEFLFTSTHAWATKMNRLLVSNYFKKRGGVIGQTLSGTMYVSSIAVETNALVRFRLRVESAKHTAQSKQVYVTTQSATDLSGVPSQSVDYVFVDPPFGDNLYYAELNFLWEAWLRVYTKIKPEAVVSPCQAKPLEAYLQLMAEAFSETHRTLKPGRWMTVEFHNSRNAVWNAIQEAILRAGFVIADVRTLEKTHKTYKQLTSTNAVKQDLVISAYKPAAELETRFKLSAGTAEGAWEFVRQHLKVLPVVVNVDGALETVPERQGFLLFDRMVAFHIQRSATIPMSAAEFYAGLKQKYIERDGMFFLSDQAAEYDRARAHAKDVVQLSLFVSDEKSAIQWLWSELEKKRQTYQQIQPGFFKELHKAGHEALPELIDILAQNFLQDEQHRWYVPDATRQVDLEKLREKVLLQEFEEYRSAKQRRLRVFRTEAVRAGFRAAYDAKDYHTIVSVAGRLPESVLQEDEKLLMYYDVASMRLGEE